MMYFEQLEKPQRCKKLKKKIKISILLNHLFGIYDTSGFRIYHN
jgi:hypothetical protein